jgi:hypothetical protein
MVMSPISKWVLGMAVALGLMVMVQLFAQAGVKQISISELTGFISNNTVQQVEFYPGRGLVQGDFVEKSEPAVAYGTRNFSSRYDPAYASDLYLLLREHHVTYELLPPTVAGALFGPNMLALAIVLLFAAAAHAVFIKAVVKAALAEVQLPASQ